MTDVRVGDRVTVSSIPGSKGTVRFAGETSFSAGRWIGVELDAGGGKNDGSVAGKRYFACKPNYGVFAKPTGVKLLQSADSTPKTRTSLASPTASARPSAGPRTSTISSSTRVSAAASPVSRPASRFSTAGTASRPPSVTPIAAAARSSGGAPLSRVSSSHTDVSRRSSVAPSASVARSPAAAGQLLSPDLSQQSPDSPGSPSPAARVPSPELMPPPPVPPSPRHQTTSDPFSLASRTEVSAVSQREMTVSAREHEETLTKLRIIERARADDRERLRDLERLKEEERNWKELKGRLQGKLVEMQAELKTLRASSKEAVLEKDAHNSQIADLNDEIEMATLDKEVAEEKVDALEANLATLRERVAELETERSVYKAAEDALSSAVGLEGTADASHLQLAQLQRQNDRLKDALAKMRDMTAEAESESRKRISELEKELDLTVEMQADFESAVERADLAEAQIEELKQQLDDAMSSEDMLVQLTDRNLTLTETIEERNTTIEQLEAFKLLADEYEEFHRESEKSLQEDLDGMQSRLREQKAQNNQLEEAMIDYEATIGQFRELVLSLQSDIEHMRRQQETQQAESQTLTSQSQAMLALNLKLQQNVNKSQIKTIDLDLRRLDALQAAEHLEIIRPYLPPSFFQGDSDAVEALLFFERLSAKVELIASGLSQKHNIAESLNTVVSDVTVAVCEARSRLARFAVLTKRFAASLRRCSTETFLAMGGLYREMSGLEKRMDIFIEALRRDDLNPTDCTREVERFIAQAAHLAETHLGESGLDYDEQQLGVFSWLDLDFDIIVAGFGFSKQTLATLSKDPDIHLQPADADLTASLFDPLQQLIDQARTAQSLTRKILRRLSELAKKSAHMTPAVVESMFELSRSLQKVAGVGVKMSDLMARYANDVRLSHSSLSLTTLHGLIEEAAINLDVKSTNVLAALDTDLALAVSRLSSGLHAVLDSEQVVQTSYTPPWKERISEIAASVAHNVDAEQRAVFLAEELRDLRKEIRIREQSMQESSVKIEVMDRRMEAIKKQAETLADLEAEVAKARKQALAYEETITALQTDMTTLNNRLSQQRDGASKDIRVSGAAEVTESIAFTGSLETSHLVAQIESLRGAVRFIRDENAFLRSVALALPPLPTVSAQTEQVRDLRAQHRSLLHETLRVASTPTMVDLRDAGKPFAWTPAARKPEGQIQARKDAMRDLSRRLDSLRTRIQDVPRMTSVGV